jgi:hypothetical protein
VLAFLMVRVVWPDADVVGLLLQLDPVPHPQACDHLARELDAPGAVQRGVLTRVQRSPAVLVGGRVPEGLAADPAVPDGDRPADLG